jgi:excisionase family DNA binding protein
MTEPTHSAEPSASVTVEEAMRQLGIKKNKIYELMASGDLEFISLPPHTKQAGRRIEQAEIDAFKARHRNRAPATTP